MFPHGNMPWQGVFKPYPTLTYPTPLIYIFFIPFIGVEGRSSEFKEPLDLRSNPFQGGGDDAILPPRVLDRRLQKDWASAAKEGPRVLMNLRVDF